ncbi:polyphenol oxidase, chloroplastic-like [Impatiens glandulifera]|uniref:polyphenol oxidase, chloroplastic-like n=1 Tax=Impatiens glandulifera TaxID=253017 RepID=UPI001FB0590F|nr:polyphenol oxidase, chloroplastic-like [Impatiens glandulifera]
MASLLLSTSPCTISNKNSSNNLSSSFLNKFKIPSLLSTKKLAHVPCKVACQAKNNDQNDKSDGKFDRRNLLIGLGGLYGTAASLAGDPMATLAAPILAPDVSKCGNAQLPSGVKPTNCCPPSSTKIVDFKLPVTSNALRVRPAAHLADADYIAKYTKALNLMKALPDSDPRSFKQQSNVHCAYCDGAYQQVGFPNLELQVHDSWLFMPFHRWYLYFFEKILGNLIGDPNFAMPYWNWDNPNGMQIPSMYTDKNSPLYDALRDARHLPPTIVDLDYNGSDSPTDDQTQISSNLTVMYRQMVSNSRTPRLFMGSPYRAGDEPDPGPGSLENMPHGPVHIWVGDSTQPNFEDMGNFYSAGRDPIFYAHHSNIDRLWSIWKTLGGRRQDFTDPDWLNSSFLFYDENAQMVRVKVKDSLDSTKLGYNYQNVDTPWMDSKPKPRNSKLFGNLIGKRGNGIAMAANGPKPSTPVTVLPKVLDGPITIKVARPKKSRSKKEKDDEEEILVIEGIEVDRDAFVKFDILINDEHGSHSGPEKTEFAGSFVNVPHKHKHKHAKKTKTDLRLGITELLEDLGCDDDDSVLVSLVPRYGSKGAVSVSGIKIEFE